MRFEFGVGMAKVSQSQEPSMEEILASIRRIISDDDDDLRSASSVKPDAISTEAIDALFGARSASLVPEPTVSEFAPRREVAAEPMPAPRPEPKASEPVVEPNPVIIPRAPLRAAAPLPHLPPVDSRSVAVAAVEPETASDELPAGRPLLSPGADAAVHAAFGDLASTLLSGQARTLEDLVKDMLRPMLKSWLDSNLPPLVERLVRDEIERVSRGR